MKRPYLLLLLALLCPRYSRAQIQFEEIARRSGIDFKLENGAAGDFHQVELMVGGVAAFDYNNDGCIDIFFTNGAALPALKKDSPKYFNRLYRNNCDGSFTDVTEKAGLAGEGYSMGVAAADYDNDGFVDLFVTGVNRNILYRNHGDGTFEDVTEKAGLTGLHPQYGKMWAIAAAWVDADNDGRLDLFVSNYVGWDPATEPSCGSADHRLYCHPSAYPARPNQLFYNNGNGTFTDISEQSGIAKSLGKGMGIAIADYDGDGRMDIFVANDSMRNFLFHNLGDGKFEELGLMAGVALNEDGRPVAGMGVDFRDFNNDGRPDVAMTDMINDSFLLFQNSGKAPAFDDVTAVSGFTLETVRLTGWGIGIYDIDNDGLKDIFTANAHFPALQDYLAESTALPNSVFRNLGNGRFKNVSSSAGKDFQVPRQNRGAAFADFDKDGRVDVAISSLDGPAQLFRNVSSGNAHWLALKLTGTKSNRDGIGSTIRLELSDGRILHNQVTTSVGYASSSELPVRFGLGSLTQAKRVLIHWPSGRLQELFNVPSDRVLEVREP
jgi:enediyne biosynthesis protein E4